MEAMWVLGWAQLERPAWPVLLAKVSPRHQLGTQKEEVTPKDRAPCGMRPGLGHCAQLRAVLLSALEPWGKETGMYFWHSSLAS